MLQSATVSTAAGVQERTSLTGRNRVLGARIVNERVEKDKIKLSAEIQLEEPGQAHSCGGAPRRKVLVTAFPLQFPEQIGMGEYTAWPHEGHQHGFSAGSSFRAAPQGDGRHLDGYVSGIERARRSGERHSGGGSKRFAEQRSD